jgi:hypothetical protein
MQVKVHMVYVSKSIKKKFSFDFLVDENSSIDSLELEGVKKIKKFDKVDSALIQSIEI